MTRDRVSDVADLVLVAHGTHHPGGLRTIGEIAEAVSARVGPVRTAFVDVLGPNPREVLADSARPALVVPAFLAAGYHVNIDLPARVSESGHPAATITATLGPDPVLVEVMHARLLQAGWRRGDPVVMAAAGSSDPSARRDLDVAAGMLSELVGEVHLGLVATGSPNVHDVVTRLRAAGHRRVAVASYLLAPGIFHGKLFTSGASAVTDPLGAHPGVIGLIADRFALVAQSCR